MKRNITYWIIFLLFFTIPTAFTQNIQHLEKQIESAQTWEEKLDLYLEIADTLMWIGHDIGKSKEYADLMKNLF